MQATTKFSPALAAWVEATRTARTWRERRELRAAFTPALFTEAQAAGVAPLDEILGRLFNHPYDSYTPRPNIDGDEQEAFFESETLVSFALGGNGSGKTYTAAQRCIAFLCERQPPPKPNTLFWVIGPTLEQCGRAGWDQKLSTMIPRHWVQWDRITWYREKQNLPISIPLQPWPERPDCWWTIEFKSYEQGREAFQAAAIGGAWFTEQYPDEIYQEVIRGTREYAFPGAIWAEFTPIDPEKSVQVERLYDEWVAGEESAKHVSFYHLNTETAAAAGHAKSEWLEMFKGQISEEMRETRLAGTFASYQGAIYKSYRPKIHLLDGGETGFQPPRNVRHKRAIDWGASEEHPFVCLWGYKDGLGVWWIYDEYWCNNQLTSWAEHVAEITSRHPWPENSPYHLQTYADPSRPDLIREFTSQGVPISAARNDVLEGIERVRLHLKIHEATNSPRLFIDKKRCPHLAKELSTYRWEKSSGQGVNPKAAKPIPLKKNDDAADALRYLIFSDYAYALGGIEGRTITRPVPRGMQFKRTNGRTR